MKYKFYIFFNKDDIDKFFSIYNDTNSINKLEKINQYISDTNNICLSEFIILLNNDPNYINKIDCYMINL